MNPEYLPSFRGFLQFAYDHRDLVAQEDTVVEFIVQFNERAILLGDSHVYSDPYLIVQLVSGERGTCFLHPGDIREEDMDICVGKPVLEVIEKVPMPIGVALLDGYFAHISKITPNDIYSLNGLGSVKSWARAKKIVELAAVHAGSKVLVIGVISDLVRALLEQGIQPRLADFLLAGSSIHGLQVERDAIPSIAWADTVIMTGNVLKTNTSEDLFERIRKQGCRLLVYCLTGANIAPSYLEYGADVVTVEKFPFYWYANLETKLLVYLSNRDHHAS